MLPVRSDCIEENPLSLLTTVLFQSDGMCERTLVHSYVFLCQSKTKKQQQTKAH